MVKTIIVREPKVMADYESMSALAEKLARHHDDNLRPDPEKLMADKGWFSARLASVDDRDVGFIGWHTMYACQSATRSIELQNLYVEPEYRNYQIGVKLVLNVIREALKLNADIKLAVLKKNPAALEFYKKLGCDVRDCKDFWRCGWNLTKMQAFAQHHTNL
ncbi:MAG: GNAT family N-acetyltransferase [Alphaproteobacteria bacterium]|nr:GNAT family N-acetyltransferase [Alphaproteobacteria bacterium]